MPSLERAYLSTGKLLFAFRHLPLDMHRNARAAAVASICAGKQKRFWEMHDQLYANERTQQWDFGTLAQSLSLVETEFTSCSEDESSRTALDKDVAMAKELGITGTPAFLIGRLQGEEVHVMEARTGAGKVEDVMAQVDRVLKAAGR